MIELTFDETEQVSAGVLPVAIGAAKLIGAVGGGMGVAAFFIGIFTD